jgi:hypothetical protein
MMKNNQLFQRLGLGQLKTLMTTTTANNKEHCIQKLGSLYDGEENDGSDCHKGIHTHLSNDGEQMPTKVTIGNKRIVAP